MRVDLLMSLFPVLVLALILQFTPLFTRRGICFSATVDPSFPHSSEGRRLLRSYRWQAALWTVLAVLLTLRSNPAHPNSPGIAPLMLLIAGTVLSYWRKFREVHACYGVKAPEVRQASLSTSAAKENFNPWITLAALSGAGSGRSVFEYALE